MTAKNPPELTEEQKALFDQLNCEPRPEYVILMARLG